MMAPTVLVGQIIRSEDLRSKSVRVSLDDEQLRAFHSSILNPQAEEPPRKRLKIEHDSEGEDESPTHHEQVSIPIAQITLHLLDASESPRISPLLQGTDGVETTLVQFESTSQGQATLKLSRADVKTAKAEVEVTLDHAIDTRTLDDLGRVAQLQRRAKSSNSSGIAYSRVELLRCQAGNSGQPGANHLTLSCTIYWPDGAAGPPETSQNVLDREILIRYFTIPVFQKQRGGRKRIVHEKTVTPQEFYDAVYVPDKSLQIPDSIDQSGLHTDLYPFQKRAVTWMLQREQADVVASATTGPHSPSNRSWRRVHDATGATCYISDLECVLISPEALQRRSDIKGGILSEEMGLGKTCELLALICTNKRSPSSAPQAGLTASKATLVVTPTTILQQWKDEITRHAPHLRWAHYEGMSSLTKTTKKNQQTEQDVIKSFADIDIVLVTYNVLASEIHFAVDPPDRGLRRKNYEQQRPKSPLVQLDWWRVCLDEAQMVESGVSKAAQTASLLPRQNAWAVSGTPVKKDVQDLRGLLIFLGYEPFASSSESWKRLVIYHETFEAEFKDLFGRIALRHTKDRIRNELRLPPQRRVVVTMPFTTIEEQNYTNLFEQMAGECGLLTDGSPASGLWDPEDARTVEKMREWLIRLRQTCLHPQVGSRNKRALGRSGGGPLRTVEEVLGVMIEQNETAINTEARMSITTLCLKGHIIANAKNISNRAEQALKYYRQALQQVQALVIDARDELAKLPAQNPKEVAVEDDNDEDSPERKKRGQLRNHLRNVLELEHMCQFFIGTAYFQMKSAEGIEENGDRWNELEADEVKHYDLAKVIRREILLETSQRAETIMTEVRSASAEHIGEGLPSTLEFASYGGIESQRLVEKSDRLSSILERQTELLKEWRTKIVDLLAQQLVDVEDTEITGDEYEDSTKQQEDLYAYFDAYRAVIADRETCITGQINTLVNHEMKQLRIDLRLRDLDDEREGREPPPSREFMRALLSQRDSVKQEGDAVLSLRGLIGEARTTEGNLQWAGNDSTRSRGEVALVKKLMNQLQAMSEAYSKLQLRFEKDQELFKNSMNQRLEFYRQLQQLSDTVAPWREEQDDTLDLREFDAASIRLNKTEISLSTLRSKRRFLIHLREQSNDEAERICVICQQNFEHGVLTVCGHQFCKDCINLWYREHRTCPVCKRGLKSVDFHNITYKPLELRAHEEVYPTPESANDAGSSSSSTPDPIGSTKIYDSMAASDLTAIKAIDLPSNRSFGTKIDTISRHLLHIRRSEPGSKTLIFSQYRDFLSVLSSALSTFGITYVSISAKDSITKFREDPSIEAFLLDAKTDSSGLNLVNATNVMLCEPLVNPSIELQAIARVHRIGQTRATSVFMYLVNGTVEESVYEVSVKRRLEIVHRSREEKSGSRSASRGTTPALGGEVDKAERLEMQAEGMEKLLGKGKSGGENVKAEDLWKCLFGVASRQATARGSGLVVNGEDVDSFVTAAEGGAARDEVARFVRAGAAEQRREGGS
ncbi:hypothetical protein KVT40_008418 [Elsinoe batatas]|uniref:Uncharacterized protein n=1 Tax=Elsinoe batatas TaxID=2601811 RepID=A0A8K0KTY2_9PEZI|nr:hypothetical protein KVT40_008418 [Elsinoe batatas]